jgi:hypothetical protein
MSARERAQASEARLAQIKSDLATSWAGPQLLAERTREISEVLEFIGCADVADVQPAVVAGTPAALLDDPTRTRVEFTSGPGAVLQAEQRRAEQAALEAARLTAVRQLPAASAMAAPASGVDVARQRLGRIRRDLISSVGSMTLVRDQVAELVRFLGDVFHAAPQGSPGAWSAASLVRTEQELGSSVQPQRLRDRLVEIVTAVEVAMYARASSGEPRVEPGRPPVDANKVRVEFQSDVGMAGPTSRAEVQLVDRDRPLSAPAVVTAAQLPPPNDTQRVEFVDAQGRAVDSLGRPIETAPPAAPAVVVAEVVS